MKLLHTACKQVLSMVYFPEGLIKNNKFINVPSQKDKVVVVVGATGAGKSRLSIDLATRFDAEVVNSDKIQVYKGLDTLTNKITYKERRGVPHHLLGFIDDPETDFTSQDFVHYALLTIDSITERGRLPIIAGGSNSFIEALVKDDMTFRSKYECCFLWVDVSVPVLHSYLSRRVDQMVVGGLVEEAKEFFDGGGDYTRGIRRAIGVPEMDEFFRNGDNVDGETRAKLLDESIEKIKVNTCILACRQLQKISRLQEILDWRIHHLVATEVFLKDRAEDNEAWERLVLKPSTRIVSRFLRQGHVDFPMALTANTA